MSRITTDAMLTNMELERALKRLGVSLGPNVVSELANILACDAPQPDGKVSIDPPRVTRDEAVELCLHHLALAAAYYEATPDDRDRQLIGELTRTAEEGHFRQAAVAFFESLWLHYEKLRKDTENV